MSEMQHADAPLARAGRVIADLTERWFPDAFVFALGVIVIVFFGGLALGESPRTLSVEFGNGFWELVPFTMQMALIIVGGFIVASSVPCSRLIGWLAAIPRTPRSAVAFTALFAMLSSLLSWGFSLIFTGLLVREIVRRIDRVDYRAIGAAAYLGLGSVWALGLSSSAALMQATPSSIPAKLLPVTGVIPLTQTIFLWQNLVLAAVLICVSVLIAWFSCPSPENARTASSMGIRIEPMAVEDEPPVTPADRLEQSPVLTLLVGALMVVWLVFHFVENGWEAALNLNTFNFIFLTLGLILQWRPRRFLRAVTRSIPATAGVIIQFPFYAGVFGMISNTSMQHRLSEFFVGIADHTTFPIIVAIYSAILGLFIPSGGGKWVLEAPYIMAAAGQLKMHLGWTVQIYNAAEALPNLLNPFWMLPLMGLLGVKARDLAGYSILQLLFHLPIVILLCWLFSFTLPYLPPVVP